MTYAISMPRFETLAIKDLIKTAENILEYGAGGTTYYAYLNNKSITTVETDEYFLTDLLKSCNYSDNITPIYVDIGPTVDWGYSLELPQGFNTIRQYVRPAWDRGDYDLVIIDGRFRVATFMHSWNRAKVGTTFFWDDFANRKHYQEIKKYIKPYAYVGRAGVFMKENNELEFSDEVIHEFVSDQR